VVKTESAWSGKHQNLGFRQKGVQGDATQQGGVLVVEPGGRIVYHHISEYPGDNASPDEIRSHLGA